MRADHSIRSTHSVTKDKASEVDLFEWVAENGYSRAVIDAVEQKIAKRRRRRRTLLASIAAVMFLTWWLPWQIGVRTYRTEAASQMAVTLPDGTHALLGSQTTLRTDFRYGRRTVTLVNGDIFLEVTHDAQHPFLVYTEEGTIEVKGTVFAVRTPRPGQAEITLVSGSLSVTGTAGPEALLKPSDQFILSPEGNSKRELSAKELERAIAWRERKITLDGLSLGEVLERFARHHARTVHMDSEVSSMTLGGEFSINDFEHFLGALPFIAPVRIEALPDGDLWIKVNKEKK